MSAWGLLCFDDMGEAVVSTDVVEGVGLQYVSHCATNRGIQHWLPQAHKKILDAEGMTQQNTAQGPCFCSMDCEVR